jgi:hypothetical protein
MSGEPTPAAAGFRKEQRRVAIGMAVALVTAVVVLAVAIWASRSAMSVPFEDRLRHTLQAETLVAAWLAAGIANVARLRFFSARDIAGSSADAPSNAVREASAVLQNTLE